jgi:hypothetical protein
MTDPSKINKNITAYTNCILESKDASGNIQRSEKIMS